MKIDPQNGTVTLPNGRSIGADCTQDAFRNSPAGAEARIRSSGTPPWIHHDFDGGAIDGHDVSVSLCFHDQLLVHVSLTVCLYPPNGRDWSNYSLETEAAEKALHERLAAESLGEPSSGAIASSQPGADPKEMLAQPAYWQRAWGKVGSHHDSHGGGTFLRVSYGNRMEEATGIYQSPDPG